nr:adenosylcobinamide-phosphate synthase CbiB [uncultured Mediterraneibacter sp.]
MVSLAACAAGFLLDYILGDPMWLYHPVRLIGSGIARGERLVRKCCKGKGLIFGGAVLWTLTALFSFLIPLVILTAAERIHPAVRFILETFWCYQIVAARCLWKESRKVYDRLRVNDLEGARRAVSMIVGRDTENLNAEGVTKAAVETVAENTSDGVTAPLLYMLVGGAPLGFLYKAVNTMDSMLGYKNEKYLYLGRIPARMDDVFNYIPSRITALFMILSSCLLGMDGKNAWKVYRRDKRKHTSPNAAQTESVCAGALRVRLSGDAVYFGKVHKKEYLGDSLRPIEPEDIKRAGRLMYMTAFFVLTVFGAAKSALILLL